MSVIITYLHNKNWKWSFSTLIQSLRNSDQDCFVIMFNTSFQSSLTEIKYMLGQKVNIVWASVAYLHIISCQVNMVSVCLHHCAFCFSHCSGVSVFCSKAWISFSSSAKQVFTILCLASSGFPSNWGDTIRTLKLAAHLLGDVSSTSTCTAPISLISLSRMWSVVTDILLVSLYDPKRYGRLFC